MNRMPPQAIAPLRERLAQLRDHRSRLSRGETIPGDWTGIDEVIQETEALIKRLENPNVPRTA